MKIQPHNYTDPTTIINQEAERCVKCALCAPVCPTYQLTRNESESPRGRIAIAQTLAQKKIPLTDTARLHLDHCLTCRACEAVCPADVKYGNLIINTQILLQRETPRKQYKLYFISKKPYNHWLRHLLRFYQHSGLQNLLRRWRFFNNSRWQRYDAYLPLIPKAVNWQSFYAAIGQELGQVGLFLNCAGKTLDQNTLLAAIKVLTYVGYSVHLPKQQECCGALALHAGQPENYQHHAKNNQQAFANLPIKAIISIASGCTAILTEYKTNTLAVAVRDINEFLLNEPWNSDVILQPYPYEVILHTPCTLKNVLKLAAAPPRLLARIPKIKLQVIDATGCCGGVGNYFLRFPDFADSLLEKTLQLIPTDNTAVILTSNIGCQLQLNMGLRAKKSLQSVIHPVVLLAQQITLKKFLQHKT